MSDLTSFAKELKHQREAKQISLSQISATTRIHAKFLEAIESGKYSVLPEVYMRAFLRQYALTIGLNPEETLRRFDAIRQSQFSPRSFEPAPSPQPALVQQTDAHRSVAAKTNSRSLFQQNLIPIVLIAGALLLVLYLANVGSGLKQAQEVTEVPFDHVVRESEAAVIKSQVSPPIPATPVPSSDSLRLEIMTADSLWLSMTIDDRISKEYIFPPHRRKIWKAKDRFVITMGNAGSATFRLNRKELGPLGKRGGVVRNAVITAQGVEKP